MRDKKCTVLTILLTTLFKNSWRLYTQILRVTANRKKQTIVVKNQRGLEVKVNSSFEDIDSLDILVIPGGAVETLMQTRDTVTLNWIKKVDKT